MAMTIHEFASRQRSDLYCRADIHNFGGLRWIAYLEELYGVRDYLNGEIRREPEKCHGYGPTPDAALVDLCNKLNDRYCLFFTKYTGQFSTPTREVLTPALTWPAPTEDQNLGKYRPYDRPPCTI